VSAVNGFRAISRRRRTRLTPTSSAAAFPPAVGVEDGDGAGRMNASAESTGMGFYKAPAAVGGARQPDATNQFANPRGLRGGSPQLYTITLTRFGESRGGKNNITLYTRLKTNLRLRSTPRPLEGGILCCHIWIARFTKILTGGCRAQVVSEKVI